MSRRGYKNNPEFVELVRTYSKRRLTYDEAVLAIKKHGFKISTKTYQRRKKEIEKLDQNRLEHLATVEYPRFTVDTIDTAKAIETQLWEIAKSANSDWEKMAALKMIMKIREELAQFYDSSPVMAALSKKLQPKKDDNQKEQSNDLEEHTEPDKK